MLSNICLQLHNKQLADRRFHGDQAAGEAATNAAEDREKNVSNRKMLWSMASYVWPKDKPWIKARVVAALSLLVGAKVVIIIAVKHD